MTAPAYSHLLATKDQPLLHGRDALLLLDFLLDLGDLFFQGCALLASVSFVLARVSKPHH